MSAVSSKQAPATSTSKPDALTLLCFAGVVLFAGTNFVAVRFSSRELDAFWGAAVRFAIASALLFVIAAVQRIPLPRGRALLGTVLYGLAGSFGAYAFLYVAIRHVPASVAASIMAGVPLLTFFFAVAHRVERFRWRGFIGGVTCIAGIAVLSGIGGDGTAPVKYLLLVVAGAACAAETGIIVKKFPRVHPIMINAVAMALASTLLFVISLATGERHNLPESGTGWLALAYLIVLGSGAMFILYVTVINRWTVTGASYQFVLFPIVAALLAAWLVDEPITASLAIGGALVVLGVYVGALSGSRGRAAPPAAAPVKRGRPVPVVAGASEPSPCPPPC